MKKIDFRSVLIGFLMAVIFFLITGQSTNKNVAEFDYIKANRMQVETLDVNGMQIQTLLVNGSMGIYNAGKTAVFISSTRDGEGAIYLFDRNENPAQVIIGKK
jgi:hypothetical protein